MNQKQLERIVLNQQSEIQTLRTVNLCHRAEEALLDLQSPLAQVVIGVRRSGKSTLCLNALEAAGVKYAYANFDDERLAGIGTEGLDALLEVLYKVYGSFTHLFLDEVQNIEGWHLFVNRVLRQRLHVVITGSNSRLLSGELASHLTGRHHQIELLPFSFLDYCHYHQVQTAPLTTKHCGLLAAAFERYMQQGGFPELFLVNDEREYINTLVKSIITQDIQHRFKVRHTATLQQMTMHLLNESPSLVVKDALQKMFELKSPHTVSNYLSYLEQTYLLTTLCRYSAKSRQRIRNEKQYAIDVALMNQRNNAFSGENLGWRLETLVYLELRRRSKRKGRDVYYFATSSSECDFVVCEGNKTLAAYQVSYEISNPKVRRRELNGLVAAAKATNCKNLYLITVSEEEEVLLPQGLMVHILPAWRFLLGAEL